MALNHTFPKKKKLYCFFRPVISHQFPTPRLSWPRHAFALSLSFLWIFPLSLIYINCGFCRSGSVALRIVRDCLHFLLGLEVLKHMGSSISVASVFGFWFGTIYLYGFWSWAFYVLCMVCFVQICWYSFKMVPAVFFGCLSTLVVLTSFVYLVLLCFLLFALSCWDWEVNFPLDFIFLLSKRKPTFFFRWSEGIAHLFIYSLFDYQFGFSDVPCEISHGFMIFFFVFYLDAKKLKEKFRGRENWSFLILSSIIFLRESESQLQASKLSLQVQIGSVRFFISKQHKGKIWRSVLIFFSRSFSAAKHLILFNIFFSIITRNVTFQ